MWDRILLVRGYIRYVDGVVAMTDGELAGAFVFEGSQEAFEELVNRHIGMVFNTCRRVAGDYHDAQDATQAVFATLAEQAGSLTSYRSLAGWLYSTAWNVSRRARSAKAVRARYERCAGPPPLIAEVASWSDEEVAELYRAMRMLPADCMHAVVLHHLKGMTVAQVAELTGWSVGTTASRLSRSRAAMRERLARRGIVAPAATLIAMLNAEHSVEARVCVTVPQMHLSLPTAGAAVASTSTMATQASIGVAASGVGLSMKWAMAACVMVSVGVGTAVAPHVRSISSTDGRRHSVAVSSSATVKSTAAGKESYDDDFYRSQGKLHSPNSWSGASNVPEPSMLSVFALGALALRRRRRRLRGAAATPLLESSETSPPATRSRSPS